ncbi:MAG: GNAT family N-acetyltransferase [Bacilli bacterium]
MIIKVNSIDDCKICDNFLTLLIQDERKYDTTIDEKFVVKDYFINMINNQNILLLYKSENKPIGYIFAKKIDDKYLIDGLYIDINFRNKGIAKKLIKVIIKEIYSLGDYEIFINVLKENKVAVNLYKNIGFIVEQEDELKFYMCYNKYKLENASIKDIERIKKYKLNTIFEYAKDLDKEEVEKINNYVNKTISNQIFEYKNIVLNNIIVGSFLITKNENGLLLDEIFIEEQYRNKGIGTSIIKDVVSKSNSNVYLWVYKDNIKAFNLYNKIGFNIKEETDSRYYMEYKVVENRK